MRRLVLLMAGLMFAAPLYAQSTETRTGWIVDDFNTSELGSRWVQVAGTWGISAEEVTAGGSSEFMAMLHSLFLMKTKPYMIEASLKGQGAGVLFAVENTRGVTTGHTVRFTGAAITTGYYDINGKYHETRAVDYILNQAAVRLRILVDPGNRTYTVTVGEREVVREALRFVSGHCGLVSTRPGAKFDFFQVLGEGQPDAPSYFLKSNQRQIDLVSYMTLMDESLVVPNPAVGMVQRLTSVGSYVNEIPVQGVNAEARGVFVDEMRWTYVVDGGGKSVRIFNRELALERMINSNLTDPRGVAVVRGKIVVLDSDGLKLFEKDGTFMGAKAAGQFKNPKNIYVDGENLYVADMGNSQVVVLNASSFAIENTIKDELTSPHDMCVDPATKDLYVADPGAGAVMRYDARGQFQERIEPMTINGFISPRAVRVRGNMLYVADQSRILGFKKDALSIRPQLRIE